MDLCAKNLCTVTVVMCLVTRLYDHFLSFIFLMCCEARRRMQTFDYVVLKLTFFMINNYLTFTE